MTNIKLDSVILSSFHEAFRNRQKLTGSITVGGSIPGFSAQTFTLDIPITRNQAVFEIYHQRRGSYARRIASNSHLLVDTSWSYPVYLFVSNPSSNVLRIEAYVTNNGSTATMTNETYDITAYIFDTPFS